MVHNIVTFEKNVRISGMLRKKVCFTVIFWPPTDIKWLLPYKSLLVWPGSWYRDKPGKKFGCCIDEWKGKKNILAGSIIPDWKPWLSHSGGGIWTWDLTVAYWWVILHKLVGFTISHSSVCFKNSYIKSPILN